VERRSDPDDGRAVLVAITPQGRKKLDQWSGDAAALLAARLGRLEPSERAALEAALPALGKLI
jgi:DNA-binding MarR family transcriptional regulator